MVIASRKSTLSSAPLHFRSPHSFASTTVMFSFWRGYPPVPSVEDEDASLSRELCIAPSVDERPGLEGIRSKGAIDRHPAIVSMATSSMTHSPTDTEISSFLDVSSHAVSEHETSASTSYLDLVPDSSYFEILGSASTAAEVDGHHGREYCSMVVSPRGRQASHQDHCRKRNASRNTAETLERTSLAKIENRIDRDVSRCSSRALEPPPRSQSACPGSRSHSAAWDLKIGRSRSLKHSSSVRPERSVPDMKVQDTVAWGEMRGRRSRSKQGLRQSCRGLRSESASTEKRVPSSTHPSHLNADGVRASRGCHIFPGQDTEQDEPAVFERKLCRVLRDNQPTIVNDSLCAEAGSVPSEPSEGQADPEGQQASRSTGTRTQAHRVSSRGITLTSESSQLSAQRNMRTQSSEPSAARRRAYSALPRGADEGFPPVVSATGASSFPRAQRIDNAEPAELGDCEQQFHPSERYPRAAASNFIVPLFSSIEADPTLQFLQPYRQTFAAAQETNNTRVQVAPEVVESVCLLPCPRSIPMAGHQDWYTIKGMTYLNICPSCTNQIIRSKFGEFFIPKPSEQKVRCSFSDPWVRLAWAQAIRKDSTDLKMLHQITRPPSTVEPCPGNSTTSEQQWYGIMDTETDALLPRFSVCQACVRNLRILKLCGQDTFERNSTPDENVCHLTTCSPRFAQYIDLLDVADSFPSSSSLLPPAGFVTYARRKVVLRECPRDRPVISDTWRCIPQLPEFSVCEDCFDDVVWPLAKAKYPIARMFKLCSSSSSRTANNNQHDSFPASSSSSSSSSSSPIIPPHDQWWHGQHEATCQLYLPWIRTRFREAVMNDDFEYLQQVALTRYRAEQQLQAWKRELLLDQERRDVTEM